VQHHRFGTARDDRKFDRIFVLSVVVKQSKKVEREEREKQQKKKKYKNVNFNISYTKPYNPRFIWRYDLSLFAPSSVTLNPK